MKNMRIFYLKNFPFLVVKFSIYLNRRVFVMRIIGYYRVFEREQRPASYFMHEQNDMNLHIAHMLEGTFSLGIAQIK